MNMDIIKHYQGIMCVCVCVYVYIIYIYTILPKVLGRPLLMNRFDLNLNVKTYNDILGKCVLLIL